jgi:endonuclease YncB( thermonuclease family)
MGNLIQYYGLRNQTEDNTPEYGFNDQKMMAKVVSVYDGDTCTVVVKINGKYQKIKIRCYGYDSPEMKPSKSQNDRDAEIKKAKAAKAALEQYCLNKIVTLHMHGFDKYGRFLATIYIRKYCKQVNINRAMIDSGHGYEYFGGTKKEAGNSV